MPDSYKPSVTFHHKVQAERQSWPGLHRFLDRAWQYLINRDTLGASPSTDQLSSSAHSSLQYAGLAFSQVLPLYLIRISSILSSTASHLPTCHTEEPCSLSSTASYQASPTAQTRLRANFTASFLRLLPSKLKEKRKNISHFHLAWAESLSWKGKPTKTRALAPSLNPRIADAYIACDSLIRTERSFGISSAHALLQKLLCLASISQSFFSILQKTLIPPHSTVGKGYCCTTADEESSHSAPHGKEFHNLWHFTSDTIQIAFSVFSQQCFCMTRHTSANTNKSKAAKEILLFLEK